MPGLKSFRIISVALVLCAAAAVSLMAQSSSSSALEEKYYREGQQALSQGHLAEARHAYEELRRLLPKMAGVHAQLGMIYFQQHEFARAEKSIRKALKLNPSLPGLHTMLALSESELGRYREAVPGLENGFHGNTPPPVKRLCGLELARAYTQLQQNTKAVEVALQLREMYPGDAEVLYHTGRIFGNYAFLTMKRLATVAPDSVWRHEAEAEAYQSEGSWDEAIREYRKVLALNPQQRDVHYWLGRTYLSRSRTTHSAQDLAAALRQFHDELRLDPSHASAAYEIAEIQRDQGQLQPARTYFEQALRAYPDFPEAQLGLAAVLLSQHQPQLAIPHLRKAIALDRGSDVAWYRLAQAYRQLGNIVEQRKAFTQFQKLRQQQQDQAAAKQVFSPNAVTPQQVGASAKP